MKICFLVNYDAPALLALNYLIPALQPHELRVFYTCKETKPTASAKQETELGALSSFDRDLIENSEKPDLIVSIRHMTILHDEVIALPPLGVINLHSGQLPKYQGVMASFRAMLNKESELGTCLHFIEDSTIDTGSIIAHSTSQADYTRSYLGNVLNIYRAGCNNVLTAIEQLERKNTLDACPQTGEPHYYSYPSTDDLKYADFKLFEASDSIDSFLAH